MSAKHTPWSAGGSENSTATWVNDSRGKRVCAIVRGENDWDHARLIAAAPELLEALKLVVARNRARTAPCDDSEACAAIAKAEGRET